MTSTTSSWDALATRLDALPKLTRKLTLCAEPEVRDRYQAAKLAADRAESYLAGLSKDTDKDARALVEKQVKDAQAALASAKAAYDKQSVTLTFAALEREQLQQLQDDHPPTEEDEEQGSDFHFDTFAPALISAASVDGMPVEYAANAMKKWSAPDSQDLWNAAWSVQQTKRSDLGKG